jgi:hypothetical protein
MSEIHWYKELLRRRNSEELFAEKCEYFWTKTVNLMNTDNSCVLYELIEKSLSLLRFIVVNQLYICIFYRIWNVDWYSRIDEHFVSQLLSIRQNAKKELLRSACLHLEYSGIQKIKNFLVWNITFRLKKSGRIPMSKKVDHFIFKQSHDIRLLHVYCLDQRIFKKINDIQNEITLRRISNRPCHDFIAEKQNYTEILRKYLDEQSKQIRTIFMFSKKFFFRYGNHGSCKSSYFSVYVVYDRACLTWVCNKCSTKKLF